MPRIYTRTGDKGRTSLYDGTIVDKSSIILEVLGELDLLISQIGYYAQSDTYIKIQSNLMILSTIIATPKPKTEKQKKQCEFVPNVYEIEQLIDIQQQILGPLNSFYLTSHYLHIVRCQVRKCERLVFTHFPEIYKRVWGSYLNRLSDLFYVVALILQDKKIKWNPSI